MLKVSISRCLKKEKKLIIKAYTKYINYLLQKRILKHLLQMHNFENF